MSYMVGYGSRYPRRIHHRGSSLPSVEAHPARIACKAGSRYYQSPNPNPNLLVGAVVGGPDSSDAFPDSRQVFQQSEPTTYINAPLVGLLAFFSAHPWFPLSMWKRNHEKRTTFSGAQKVTLPLYYCNLCKILTVSNHQWAKKNFPFVYKWYQYSCRLYYYLCLVGSSHWTMIEEFISQLFFICPCRCFN